MLKHISDNLALSTFYAVIFSVLIIKACVLDVVNYLSFSMKKVTSWDLCPFNSSKILTN